MGTLHHLPARSLAVFVSPLWKDQAAIRLWAKLLGGSRSGTSRVDKTAPTIRGIQVELVMITDDVSEGNAVLARQLRCSGIVCAVARLPTVLRSQSELDEARKQRDSTMAVVADAVWDFGGVFVGTTHKPVTVVPMDPV